MNGDSQMRAFYLPDGDAGVSFTLHKMEGLVAGPQGIGSAEVRAAALQAVRGSVRNVTEIQSVLEWVKANIEFRGEAEETLQSPEATLKFGAGDCDDISMLIDAMLATLGYQWAFKAVATSDDPGQFTHVYAMVLDKVNHQWVALDGTVQESFPGWEPRDLTRQWFYKDGKVFNL